MGLFSSIKKAASKAWSGVKKVVKGVAKTVKKVAKKVAYSTPVGRKLWDHGSKIGDKLSSAWKEVKKGFVKFSSKLGPVGMMALSFVLAPVVGPMLGAMWSGFGAGAAAMATSANAFVSTLGSIGSGVFATGNFIGGTLGAMGNAITEGASNVMAGNFSGAANAFATNMSNAFTGQAGMAAVNAGAAQAAMTAGNLAGSTDAMTATTGNFGIDQTASFNAEVAANQAGLSTDIMANAPADFSSLQSVTNNGTIAGINPLDVTAQTAVAGTQELAGQALYGKAGNLTLTEQDAFMKYGAEGVKAIQPVNMSEEPMDLSKAKDALSQAKSLLGGSGAPDGYQPYTAKAIQAQGVPKAGGVSGQGSSGFSLLGGVQGLEQSIRNSQNMMFG